MTIPNETLASPFTVIATTRRTTGRDAGFAHYGVGVEDSFTLREAAHGGDVRVTRPPLGVRPVTDTYAAAAEDGLGAVGWVATLPKAGDCGDGSAGVQRLELDPERRRGDRRHSEALPWGTGAAVRERVPRNVQFVVACSLWDVEDVYANDPTAVEIAYSLALLPDEPMVPRRADDRVGYFGTTYEQLGPLPQAFHTDAENASYNDADRRVNLINRRRLERDDDCQRDDWTRTNRRLLCTPVQPITYHLDPTVPQPLREAIKRGVLTWQPASKLLASMKPSKSWSRLTTIGRRSTIRGRPLLVDHVAALPRPRPRDRPVRRGCADGRDLVREHRVRRGLDPGLHGELARRGVDRARPVRARSWWS